MSDDIIVTKVSKKIADVFIPRMDMKLMNKQIRTIIKALYDEEITKKERDEAMGLVDGLAGVLAAWDDVKKD